MEDSGCANSGALKRCRDDPEEEAPEAKRIHAADLILLDVLDDAEPADGDLASVMKSLEEEIAPFSSPQEDRLPSEDGGLSTSAGDHRESDLGYLLEASDDELGLPPTVASPSEEGDGAEGDLGQDGTQGLEAFGHTWGLEDEIQSCYDALGLAGYGQVTEGWDDGLVFDGGLFDSFDAGSLAGFS